MTVEDTPLHSTNPVIKSLSKQPEATNGCTSTDDVTAP